MADLDSTLDWFADEQGKLRLFTPRHDLRVPPQVDVVWESHRNTSSQGMGDGIQLVYPDSEWQQRPIKGNTTHVLNAFLKLAHVSPTQRGIETVRKFAATWGPLWLCQTPGHHGYGSADCSWPSNGPVQPSPCSWEPQEPFADFIRKAKEAKAALEIAEQLRRNHGASETLWSEVGIDRWRQGRAALVSQSRPTIQRQALAVVVNGQLLSRPLGLTLLMTWEEATHAKLALARGGGFLYVVWLQIAQLLCEVKGLYPCDECGDYYIRRGRKPQAGRRQFCEACGEGGKASKRQYARRERSESKTP